MVDKAGNTPLHNAAFMRNLPMCQMLCEFFKVDINVCNNFGCTPLHASLFAFDGQKDHTPAIERYLLSKGANPVALDHDKRMPLIYLFFKNKISDKHSDDPAGVL